MKNIKNFGKVLIVIDAQRDFLSPSAPYSCINVDQVVQNIAKTIFKAQQAGLPVIYTREAHDPAGRDYGLEAEIGEPAHCVLGTHGFEIVPELQPLHDDLIIDKRRYDAFLGTHLNLLLRQLGCQRLFVCGFTTNACVHATTMGAFQRDYPVQVIEECVSGTSLENHQLGLQMLRAISPQLVISLAAYFCDIA